MKHLVEAHDVVIVIGEITVEGFKLAIKVLLTQDYEKIVENVNKSRELFCWEEQEKILLGGL
jgi:hypothetical protein